MLSAIEIDSLRSQGVSEDEIVLRNGGPLPFASFGEPEYMPMGTTMAGDEVDMGFTRDANGNPIINPDNLVSAQPVFAPAAPSQDAIDAGIANDVNDPAYIHAQQQREQQQIQAQQSQAPVVQQQAEQMNGMGGPDTPVDNGMQGFDPMGSFLGGFAGSQAPAYSGSLQAIAAAMGQGSMNMQKEMAANRRSLNSGKFGNTPIPYQKPDGTMGMGRMAPDGTFLPMEVPGGGEFLKPTTWLNTGTGHMPVGYGKQYPTQGAEQVIIQPPPETAPAYKGEQTAATSEATRVADINVARPKARNMLESVNVKADFVSGTIDEAVDNITNFSTGFGAYLSKVPGTQAKYLSGLMDTIRANVGFEALQEMRNNSPTGGALGQVSERELELLNSTIGKLDQAQTSDQLKGILREIQEIVKGRGARMRNAFDRDYGGDKNMIDKYGESSSSPNNLPDFPDPE